MNERERFLITEEEKQRRGNVYRTHHKELFLLAARLTGLPETAKDIVQDACIKLLTHEKKFDHAGGIKAFLLTTVRNACIDFTRHRDVVRSNEPRIAERWDTTLTEAELEMVHTEVEVMRLLQESIKDLPEKQRLIAQKTLVEGYSNRDVARMLGEKYHRVRYLRDRLIQALKKKIFNK